MANMPAARQFVSELPALPTEQHAHGDECRKKQECNLEYRCGCERRGDRTDCDADDCGQRPDADYLGDYRTFLFMSEIGTHRRGHDDRQRGAYTGLDANLFGHVEYTKHLVQHRHDDGSAADPE